MKLEEYVLFFQFLVKHTIPSMLWSTFLTFFLQPSQWMLTLKARVWQTENTRKKHDSHLI